MDDSLKRNFLSLTGGPKSTLLHEVKVNLFGYEKCMEIFRLAGLEEQLSDVFICAGWEEGGKDACEVSYVTTDPGSI